MYCSHFGLQRLPFNNTPDPSFYYSTPDHEEALATLQYATQQRRGFVLVTGEIGAGKTLIGRIFLRQMDTNSTTAVISQTHLTGRQLLAAICSEFGLPAPAEATNLELTQTLQEFLVEQFARNRFVVVLLDEAQNLPDESFEELRMLGNLEADDAKLLQVCILGQPELRERFRKPSMKQLDQRLFRRFHLPSLSRQQTGEYILHRLGVSGCRNENLFTQDAIERIFAASGGIPRLINQICDNALLTAYGQDRMQVDAKVIDVVLERDASLMLQAPIGATSERQFAPGGLHAGKDAFPMSAESIRLAELALDQTNELRRELDAISGVASAGQVRQEIEKISQRQGELHKIVAGATTRWLAAKEKLDEYRKEIQAEIREVIVRCHRTQERLEEMERSAAPAEDLEEIRENHLRETNRLLGLMQAQRNEFTGQLEQVQQRWAESEKELRSLAEKNAAGEALEDARRQCESATREMVRTLEAHRTGILDQITQLRSQCDAAHAQLRSIDAEFQRRCTEADRRVQDLSAACTEQQERLATLQKQLSESRTGLQMEIGSLQERLTQLAQADAGPAEETRRLREQLASLAEELNRQHQATTTDLQRQLHEQLSAIQTLRRAVDQAANESDRLHQKALEQVATRTSQLEYQVESVGKEMSEVENRWAQELRRLTAQFAPADELSRLQSRQSEQAATLVSLGERSNAIEREHAIALRDLSERTSAVEREHAETLSALSERHSAVERKHGETLNALNERHSAVEREHTSALRSLGERTTVVEREQAETLKAMTQRGAVVDRRLDQLAEASEQQRRSAAELQDRVQEQRRLLEDECRALSARCQHLQAEVERLAANAAPQADLRQLRQEYLDTARRVEKAIDQHSGELNEVAQRLSDWSQQSTTKLEQLRADSVRPQDVEALRDAMTREAAQLSEAIGSNAHRWQQTAGELAEQTSRQAAQLRDLGQRTQTLEQATAELREIGEKSATRDDLDALSRRHVKLQVRVLQQIHETRTSQRAELMQTLEEARTRIEAQLATLSQELADEAARSEQSKAILAERIEEVASSTSKKQTVVVEAIERTRLALEAQLTEVASRLASGHVQLEREQSDLVERIKEVRAGASDQLVKACEAQRSEMVSTIEHVRSLLQTQLGNIAQELADTDAKTRENDQRLEARILENESQHSADVAELNRRWEELRTDLDQLERTAAPTETLAQVQESLTANVSDVRHQLAMTNSTHALRLKTLVDKLQETASRVMHLEREASPYRINLKPEVMNELGSLVKTATTERESLTAELERAHAVSAHFRNTSSQVQEIMEDWTRQSGDVRDQADALRSSAETAKAILEAMKRCNQALDSKINSQRWTSELERGEALVSRLEQVISSGRLTAGRLESLLGDFDARRSEAEEWERRHGEVVKAADRLEQLVAQSREAGNEVEKAVASRQRLIAAMARNASQLAEVIQSARIEDETERPTPMPPPAEAAPAPAPRKPAPAVKPSVPTNAKPAPSPAHRTAEAETSRIAWPKVPAPLIAARR